MPNRDTFYTWLRTKEGLPDKYAQAREAQADFFADDIIKIADFATDAQLARLQIDARKWKAAKTAPKKYGDKLDIDLGGEVKVRTLSDFYAGEPDS